MLQRPGGPPRPGETGRPVAPLAKLGPVVMTVCTALVASLLPVAAWRLALVAVAVGIFAALSRDWLAIALNNLLVWVVVNAFLVDGIGHATWYGPSALVIILAGWLGQVAGIAVFHTRAARRGRSGPGVPVGIVLVVDDAREHDPRTQP